ncbi:hypothetical protein HDV05_005716 [Chytridiales sp. JEL 0842]|nr:hypothetical protein HDV05_005716 [Chytridiales sp. JEL 0842]
MPATKRSLHKSHLATSSLNTDQDAAPTTPDHSSSSDIDAEMYTWTEPISDPYEEIQSLHSFLLSKSTTTSATTSHNHFASQKSPLLSIKVHSKMEDVTIKQDRTKLGGLGVTGEVVWDSSVVLGRLLASVYYEDVVEQDDDESGAEELSKPSLEYLRVENKRCIELGTGTGLLSLVLSHLPTHLPLIATDLLPTLSTTLKNIQLNYPDLKDTSEIVTLMELEWSSNIESKHIKNLLETWSSSSSPQPTKALKQFKKRTAKSPVTDHDKSEVEEERGIDLILAADCIYNDSIVPAFICTLRTLCSANTSKNKKTRVLIAQELRAEEVHVFFLEEMKEAGFEVWRVPIGFYNDFGEGFEKGVVVDDGSRKRGTEMKRSGRHKVVVYVAWLA